MTKKEILITGGLGYIGSHAVIGFYEAGFKPIIIDKCSNSNFRVLDNIEKIIGFRPKFYEIDLRNKDILEKIFETHCIDGVVHFAGLKAVGESCEKPLEYFDNNIIGSLRLFECMKSFDVKNIIFSSSATVYSPENFIKNNDFPISETAFVGNTTNPYGTTKFILEKILLDLAKFYDFRVMNLRYFNPIGAHKSGLIGEDPQGIPNNLLPFIFKVASGEFEYLKIFGNDYNTKDGTGMRDYIDVIDLIQGHIKSYNYLRSNDLGLGFFKTLNLGTGRALSVLEILSEVEKVVGFDIRYIFFPRRVGDLDCVYCDPSLAKELLGWESKTPISISLENSWKYYNL